jgi:hypothetical protein
MARTVEIIVATGSSHRRQDTRHGVEPESWSKFWATEDDEESDENLEEEDDTSTPILIQVIDVGFFIDQLQQAENQLESPTTATLKEKILTHFYNHATSLDTLLSLFYP